MWTSAELKERAKVALRGTYWKAFAISLIVTFVSGGVGSGFSAFQEFNGFDEVGTRDFHISKTGDMALMLGVFAIVIGIVGIIMLISLGFKLFVGYPIIVGSKKYFIEAAESASEVEKAKFNLLGHAFKGPHYLDVIKSMFVKDLYVFLWTLLLIIPGIVKGYSYAMVPYILADNPNIGVKRSIELSREMTDGEKLDMFILDLSFIGWFILALIPCGLGYYFLNPYYFSTHTELYRVLREKALTSNICSFEELGFSRPSEEI